MLRCGLHAVNAILRHNAARECTADELDAITARLHATERSLCATAGDLTPHPDGNYPVHTLMTALGARGLVAQYERPANLVPRRHVLLPRNVVAFLVGTGDHYVAVVRARGAWRLIDNGAERDPGPHASPFAIARAAGARAVLRVIKQGK